MYDPDEILTGVGDSSPELLVPDRMEGITRKLRQALTKSTHLMENSEPTQEEEHGNTDSKIKKGTFLFQMLRRLLQERLEGVPIYTEMLLPVFHPLPKGAFKEEN